MLLAPLLVEGVKSALGPFPVGAGRSGMDSSDSPLASPSRGRLNKEVRTHDSIGFRVLRNLQDQYETLPVLSGREKPPARAVSGLRRE